MYPYICTNSSNSYCVLYLHHTCNYIFQIKFLNLYLTESLNFFCLSFNRVQGWLLISTQPFFIEVSLQLWAYWPYMSTNPQQKHMATCLSFVFMNSIFIILPSKFEVAFTNIVSSLHFITPDFSPTYPRSCQLPLSLPLDKATSNFAFSLFIYLIVFLACSSLPDALHKLFSIMLNFNLSCSLELSILSLLLEILFKSHISNYFLNMCL